MVYFVLDDLLVIKETVSTLLFCREGVLISRMEYTDIVQRGGSGWERPLSRTVLANG